MEFRDYAAKETAALFSRLMASQAEASAQHLRTLRDALESAARGIESTAQGTPEGEQDVQELIRRLNTASGTAAKMAAQKVQKEAQVTLEAVQQDLNSRRAENEQLTGTLSALQAEAAALRDKLQQETERAESLDRDLDAAIEAHSLVDAQRLEAEADVKKQTAAIAGLEKDLNESRGLLDTTVADAARLSGELGTARADIADLQDRLGATQASAEQASSEARAAFDAAQEELRSERERAERLTTQLAELQAQADILLADLAEAETQAEAQRNDLAEAQAQASALRDELGAAQARIDTQRGELEAAHGQIDSLRNELGEAHRQADALRGQLGDVQGQLGDAHSQLEAARGELTNAHSQVETLRADVQRETERADSLDRDLDAAIEAHGNVDVARVEAEAECRRQTTAAAAAVTEVAEVRAHLDVSVAQVSRLQMQLETNSAENGMLAADLSAAQAELGAARTQREAVAAQLEASRARIQTLERNHSSLEDQVRHLESALADAHAQRGTASDAGDSADTMSLRDDVARMGSLIDTSVQAVEELAEKTTTTDLFAALVRHLAAQFSRVALFRVKANRLEGEDQIGFDHSTDVTKLVLPLSVDSLITRAASSGSVEQLLGEDLADSSRAPFAGTPTVALAMPIAFQGETLAVVYADSDQVLADRGPAGHEANISFARLLVRTAGVLLMRLSQELKTLNELREYAAMLLQEAQEMYSADTQAQKGDDERRSRLKDTIECARQLYAQRAALEGAAAASLFDDRISAVLESDGDTQFGRDLAAIGGTLDRHVESRRAAEAS
jgi:chromosome segregation ATPase